MTNLEKELIQLSNWIWENTYIMYTSDFALAHSPEIWKEW